MFRIPERVPTGRHFLHDELTDLTGTFNEMSDELMVQYSRLEERVKLRTAELEQTSTQITSIFDKQAREAHIDLKAVHAGPANDGRGALGDANLSPHKELEAGAIHRTPSSVPAYGPGH